MRKCKVLRWPSPSNERCCELSGLSREDYWQTPEWAMMRKFVMWRDKFTCKMCGLRPGKGKSSLCVHHSKYRRRGTEEPRDLITLCHKCHGEFHRHKNGGKSPSRRDRTMAEAEVDVQLVSGDLAPWTMQRILERTDARERSTP